MDCPRTWIRDLGEALSGSKFGQDVLWNALSLVPLAGGGLVINLVIARARGSGALGVFSQVLAIYVVLSQMGVGGLQFSVLKHVSHSQRDRGVCAETTVVAVLLASIVSGGIACGCYGVAGQLGSLLGSASVGVGLRVIAPGLVLFSVNKVLIMALNGLQDMKAYAVFRALRPVLVCLGLIAAVLAGLPDAQLAVSVSAAEMVLLVCLVVYINGRLFKIRIPNRFWELARAHMSFGARGVMSGILVELNTRVDILMLGFFSTDQAVGIYSVPAALAEGFSQLPLVARWNVDPILGRHFSEGTVSEIGPLAKRVRRVMVPIMVSAGLLGAMVYPLVLGLVVPEAPVMVSWCILVIIFAGVVANSGFRPFSGILLQGGRPGAYTLLVGAVASANVVLNCVLIPLLGVYGAATATGGAFLLEALAIRVCAKRLLGVVL
ncbi:oligosaccharide flippase family protein [Candidatus Latescibacterota bacterium]